MRPMNIRIMDNIKINNPRMVRPVAIQAKNAVSPLDTFHLDYLGGTHDRDRKLQLPVVIHEILAFRGGQVQLVHIGAALGGHPCLTVLRIVECSVPPPDAAAIFGGALDLVR